MQTEKLLLLFVPSVTQGNENAGSIQDFIFLFLCLVFIKRIWKQGESYIPLFNPNVESFSLDLLRAIISYWAGSY